MDVEIGNLSTEVVFSEGEMPIDERQMEMLVSKVAERIREMQNATDEASTLTELDANSPSFQKLHEN